MTLKSKRRLIALVVTLVMALSLAVPVLADDKLDTPVLITVGDPLLTADGNVQNPARHTQFRLLLFEEIEGATGYDVYAFPTRADAIAGENAVAVAKNVGQTTMSQSGGGTQGTLQIEPEEGQVGIDVRLLQFEDLVDGATRTLPAGYTPAGLGDSYMPGAPNSGDTTNLKPGAYWFGVVAVDSEDDSRNSDLSVPHEDAYSISIGPDEARDIILARLDELGDTPEATLRLIDLRGPAEFAEEGTIRFFDDRVLHTDFNTVEKAEAVFGHVDDKSAVTIFFICRGGGRTASAARHLSDAGYTNIYNMQGINQWSFGLRYDDPTFRFRQVEEGDEHDLAPASTADTPGGIFFDEEAGALKWYNIPRADFYIYAFETEDEEDIDEAVAVGTLPAIALDVSGSTRDHRWVRVFNLSTLDLPVGDYFIRVQAVPDVEVEIDGTDLIWGAPSVLSDAIAYTSDGEQDLDDQDWDDWAVAELGLAIESNLIILDAMMGNWQQATNRLLAAEAIVQLIEIATGMTIVELAEEFDFDLTDEFDDTDNPAATFLKASGISTGVDGENYDPDGEYNRAQMVTMLGRVAAFLYDIDLSEFPAGTDVFEDLDDFEWASPFVGWAADAGITTGTSETEFNPSGVLQNQHTGVFAYRAYLYFSGSELYYNDNGEEYEDVDDVDDLDDLDEGEDVEDEYDEDDDEDDGDEDEDDDVEG